MPPRVKAIANYQNSRYVADESSRHGYDFGIILNPQARCRRYLTLVYI